jgi:hypothetical protein
MDNESQIWKKKLSIGESIDDEASEDDTPKNSEKNSTHGQMKIKRQLL